MKRETKRLAANRGNWSCAGLSSCWAIGKNRKRVRRHCARAGIGRGTSSVATKGIFITSSYCVRKNPAARAEKSSDLKSGDEKSESLVQPLRPSHKAVVNFVAIHALRFASSRRCANPTTLGGLVDGPRSFGDYLADHLC